jgi:hypothetical protein
MKAKATAVLLVGLALGAPRANAAVSVAARRAVRCAEAKIKAVRKKVNAELACQARAVRKRIAVNGLCIANAEAAFLRAFARAEAKGGCFNPNGNSEPRTESRVSEFIDDIGSLLIPCTPQGSTCGPPRCNGRLTLCVSDVSGAPVCADTNNCRQTCTSDAVCDPGHACVSAFGGGRCCDICQ